MAQTTRTTVTDQVLSEVIAEAALSAARPKNVLSRLCNQTSIAGMPAASLSMPRHGDIGAAASVSETADISSTTLTAGTQSTFTPLEYGIMAEVTYKAARRRMPGLASVHQLFNGSASLEQQLAVFADDSERLGAAQFEALEAACIDALDSLANSVGSTTVNLALSDMEDALYTYETLEVSNEDLAFVLAPRQIADLRTALTTATGTIWSTDIQSIMERSPDTSKTGLQGAFLGVPTYTLSNSIVNTANAGADVVGALIPVGRGDPVAGQAGAVVIVEGEPLFYSFETDNSKRSVEIQAVWEWAAGLRATDYGVKIVTDA